MSEAAIVRGIIKWAKEAMPDAFIMKIHGGPYQKKGVPDILVVNAGKIAFLEVKQPGGRTSPIQRHRIEQLIQAGAYVGVVTSKIEAASMLSDWGVWEQKDF